MSETSEHELPADVLPAETREYLEEVAANGSPHGEADYIRGWHGGIVKDRLDIEAEKPMPPMAVWVKPWWVTFGLGGLGLLLVVGFFVLPGLAAKPMPDWLAWTRVLSLLVGAIMLVIAAPVEMYRDRLPQGAGAEPESNIPRPLKTRR